ncbi:MAG: LuxR C-terminal-related transcriptional regulator, partial [Actinomycetota bacterium]
MTLDILLSVPTRGNIAGVENSRSDSFKSLSFRESQILEMLSQGKSTDAIAEQLALSRGTVRNHISLMLRKTGTHSRLE